MAGANGWVARLQACMVAGSAGGAPPGCYMDLRRRLASHPCLLAPYRRPTRRTEMMTTMAGRTIWTRQTMIQIWMVREWVLQRHNSPFWVRSGAFTRSSGSGHAGGCGDCCN